MKNKYCIGILVVFMLPYTGIMAEVVFRYVDPLDKILPERNVFMNCPPEAHVARGEHATFQFAVRSNEKLKNVNIRLTELVHTATGISLPLDGVRISYVGNVHVGRTQSEPGTDILHSTSGFYPDPLLDDDVIDIPADVTTPVWVSVPVETRYVPGEYKGDVILESLTETGEIRKSSSVRLYIYSAVVDTQTLMVTNWYQPGFNCVDGKEVEQFSARWWELMDQLAGFMKRYRQNVVMIAPLRLAEYTFRNGEVATIDFARFDEMVRFFQDKGILRRIAGGHIAGRTGGWNSEFGYYIPVRKEGQTRIEQVDFNNEQAKRFYKKFFRELLAHLESKGWLDIYMQHIADEPVKSNSDSYIAISSYMKSLAPGLKIIDACHTKDLDNRIDVWVPQLNYLHRDFKFYRTQQQKGKEVWYYTCVWPQGEYANRYIRQPLLKARLLHWINYKYAINGYLHWGLNFWRGDDPMTETAAIQPDGLVLPGGDAWAVYPYKRHLIPSIRLEAMRDGIADYELLCQLEKKNLELAKKLASQMVYDFDKYDMDIVHFRNIRKQLLNALEEPSSP